MPIHLPSLWLDPISCRLVSPLSSVDWSLKSPFANCQLRAPLSNSLPASPYLPVTSRSRVQNPLSGFALKQTKESSAWRTTYIVLQLCIYHLFVWSNFNFLHNSQWITLPTQLCLVLLSFCDNLLHSLIMWLIVSSLSPHKLHLLFCWVLSVFALIWLVLMALFCAAMRRDLVSLLNFSFLSHVHVFSCEMSLVSRLKRP